ncbi:MAG: hypothetical protein IT317_03775 [Anaerolineales bacterium]|nr:hypothetical protein [Anaerolineales bacterium]
MAQRPFWPIVLIAFGLLLLLDNLGFLPGSAWGYVWPALLIFVGLSLLLGRAQRAEPVEDSVGLDGAGSAEITFEHGAGVLEIYGGAQPDHLLEGTFTGGVQKRIDRHGDQTLVTLSVGPEPEWYHFVWPWNWMGGRGQEWNVRLNPHPRLSLRLKTGASETRLDLSDLRVAELSLDIGAGSTRLTLPAHAGWTKARVASGAASVEIVVPAGVAARIHGTVAVGSLNVDQQRFPRRNGGYESPDYETATHRVELNLEGGVGSTVVR